MSKSLAAAVAQQREQSPYEKFRNRLFQVKPELAPLLGSTQAVDKFVRVALNAVQANPALLNADGRSLMNSCMKAAQDGLLPDGREAVFNIYNTKIKEGNVERWVPTVQYLPMVGGLIKKLYDSGHVTFVDGVAVYERDEFKYQRGDDPKIEHVPYGGSDEPGTIVAAYAIVKLKNGETKREVMWARDLAKVRAAAKTDHGWKAWEDQFAIKSVIKRAYKQVPSAPEVDSIIQSDNAAMGFTGADINLLPEVAANAGTAPPDQTVKTADPVGAGTTIDLDEAQDAGLRSVEKGANAGTGATIEGDAKREATTTQQATDAAAIPWPTKIINALNAATAIDTLELAYDLRLDPAHEAELNPADREELDRTYQQRRLDLAPKSSKKK